MGFQIKQTNGESHAKKHTMFFPTIFKHPKNGSYTNLFIGTNADLVISKWD
jgi:hypothetical protein